MARRPRLLSPTVALRRGALYKGLIGGNRGWMAIGVVVWGPRLMRKLLGRTEVLRPGQALRLEAIAPPTRDDRRAARRAR